MSLYLTIFDGDEEVTGWVFGHYSDFEYFPRSFALKFRKCAWTESVQGAVATWSVISMRYFLTIVDSHDLTRSLPLPVLTRSKCDSRLLRQSLSATSSQPSCERRIIRF